jgi:hypothetical protein
MSWPGGLLALGLALGCRHTQLQPEAEPCTNCTTTITPVPSTGALPQRLALVPTPEPLAPTAPPSLVPMKPIPLAAPPSQIPVTRAPISTATPTPAPTTAAPRTLPAITTSPGTATPPQPLPSVNGEQSAPPAKVVMPKAEPLPTTVVPTPAPTPTPVTTSSGAAPQYYNSPDYTILFGVLDYNARRGTWRLRYADASEEDRYGGSVTLDDVGRQMDGYTAGQFIRVEGSLVDPESRDAAPKYRVKDMRPGTAK